MQESFFSVISTLSLGYLPYLRSANNNVILIIYNFVQVLIPMLALPHMWQVNGELWDLHKVWW